MSNDSSTSNCSVFGRAVAIGIIAAALTIAAVAAQAPQPAKIDVQALGPQIGSRVPELSAQDQHGRTHTLASIMGPKGAMLVFNRSADW